MSETKLRYSKQRETIYEVLKNDWSHPLNLLADHKRITRLDIGDGVIHFDARIEPHFHMVCDECGTIQDIVCQQSTLDELINKVNEQSEHDIHGAHILFHGTCSHCLKKKS